MHAIVMPWTLPSSGSLVHACMTTAGAQVLIKVASTSPNPVEHAPVALPPSATASFAMLLQSLAFFKPDCALMVQPVCHQWHVWSAKGAEDTRG